MDKIILQMDGAADRVFVPEPAIVTEPDKPDVPPKPVSKPNRPTEVTVDASAGDGTTAEISWFDASDNENGFNVFVINQKKDETAFLESVGPGVTRTTANGLSPDTNYIVGVGAYNAAGEATSDFVALKTPPAPIVVTPADPLSPTPGGPFVAILSESTAGVLLAPAVGVVAAIVTPAGKSADEAVKSVSFYVNGSLGRTARGDAPPFIFAFHSLAVGTYTLTVVATDAKGRRGVASRTLRVVGTAFNATKYDATPGTLQTFLDGAKPGDVIVVQGTHKGQFRVTKGGAEGLPVQIQFLPGAKIDATGKPFALTPAKTDDPASTRWVSLQGVNIVGCSNGNGGHNAALILGNDWTAVGGNVSGTDGTGVGMSGVRCAAFGLTSEKNGQNGISSSRGKFVGVVACFSRGNNTKKNNPASEGGGGKFARTNWTIADLSTFEDNIGPGLWHDISNENYAVVRNTFRHNVARNADKLWQGAAYRSEINTGPGVASDNMMIANDGAGLSVDEATDFSAFNNHVRDGGDGVELRNLARKDNANTIMRVTIVDNYFINLNRGVATSSAVAPGYEWSTARVKDWKINIDRNYYEKVKSPIVWAGKTYKGRTDFGMEPNGVFQA